MTSRQSLAMVAAGMLVMQGCLGPDIVQETPPPTPAIEVAPHSPTATVHEGLVSNATVRVNLTRHGGFAGPVAVTLEGLPPGVAAAQGSIGANATSVNLALTVGAGVPANTHTVTIRAKGEGVSDATTSLTLEVRARPALQITLNPAAVVVRQGVNGQVALTVNRDGYTGIVAVTAENLPQGVTAQPVNIAAGAATGTMTFVANGAQPGVATVTIRASGGVLAKDGTVPLSLSVAAGGPEATVDKR